MPRVGEVHVPNWRKPTREPTVDPIGMHQYGSSALVLDWAATWRDAFILVHGIPAESYHIPALNSYFALSLFLQDTAILPQLKFTGVWLLDLSWNLLFFTGRQRCA